MRPKRSLGQNFLTDLETARSIVRAAEVKAGDPVLEVGPGRGFLTKALLEAGGQVTAVEIDDDLCHELGQRFPGADLRLIHRDFMQLDLHELALPRCPIVGNLPYNRASNILRKALSTSHLFTRMVFMFQWEVARRICASPGSGDYGIPSVAVALSHRAGLIRKIPPGAFFPAPKVHSAVVLFQPLETPLLPPEDRETFLAFVSAAFRQRRKMVRTTLAAAAGMATEEMEEALARVGLSASLRPDEIPVAQMIELWHSTRRPSGATEG